MARKQGRNRARSLNILIIDDHIDQAQSTALTFAGAATAIPRTPDDVTEADLQRAHVVLIDYDLDDWPSDDGRSIAEHPKNGVALAAVFRSYASADSRTAFALHSAKLDGLSGGLTVDRHLNSIARLNNVEWVFSKRNSENERPLRDQVLSLAMAMYRLPTSWPITNSARIRADVVHLLGLRENKWSERAWTHVQNCHPPIHDLSPPTYGVTFIRWLLTSILPYSTFLWDFRQLSARLRVTPISLKEALLKDRQLARKLSPYEYRGTLQDFLGRRWWRAGVEHFLLTNSNANPFGSDELQRVARGLSRRLRPITLSEPVVAFDEELRPKDELVELSDAVELHPDDWPAYAGKPWVRRALAESRAQLMSLLAPAAPR
jgi:hypothetical protein